MISKLSYEEKIGQRFIVGIKTHNIEDIIYLIKKYYIGGVVLYKNNYDNYQEMLNVINSLKTANKNNKISLFIAIDQEGGFVNRFPSEILNLKSIYDISKTSNKLVCDSAMIISNILKNTGINMNLAPVLDIYNESKVLYKRCFYGDESDICRNAKTYINEFNKNNIISVIKHFPGHGMTKFNSHFFIPYIFNYRKIISKNILPFNEIINNGIDAVMVGHFIIRKMTGFYPSSISRKFVTKYLRNECNYDGVVMTDELNMLNKNILFRHNLIKKSINSDSDILLVKIKNLDEGIKIMEKAYKNADNNMLDINVKRIVNLKEKYKINDDINYSGIDIDKINKEIDKVNNQI